MYSDTSISIIRALAVVTALLSIAFVGYRIKRVRRKKVRRQNEVWSIGMYEGPDPATLSNPATISNPVLTPQDVTDIEARFVADPFMISHDGAYHLFFEALNTMRNKGEIGHAMSRDLKTWNYTGIVLKGKHHLSYPYVFRHDGVCYMIPECAKSGAITLYKAVTFPSRWESHTPLITGPKRTTPLLDPSIVQHDGNWYLFSYNRKSKSLHLFVSKTLTGPWKEHPESPIISGNDRTARPAGRIVSHDGALYRYAQDGTPHYGSKAWGFRITELTPESYREEPASDTPVVQAGNKPWNNAGMHTVDPHPMEDGRWIAMVDGLEFRHLSAKDGIRQQQTSGTHG